MRAVRLLVAVACAAVLAGGVVVAWRRGPEPLTRDEAAAFAADALGRIGLDDVRVDPSVEATTYRPSSTGDGDDGGEVPVWSVLATVDGGTVRLLVHEEAGEAVRVEDQADDGGPLLSDDQFAELDAITAGVDTEWRRLAGAATLAGVAGAAVAVALAVTESRRR